MRANAPFVDYSRKILYLQQGQCLGGQDLNLVAETHRFGYRHVAPASRFYAATSSDKGLGLYVVVWLAGLE